MFQKIQTDRFEGFLKHLEESEREAQVCTVDTAVVCQPNSFQARGLVFPPCISIFISVLHFHLYFHLVFPPCISTLYFHLFSTLYFCLLAGLATICRQVWGIICILLYLYLYFYLYWYLYLYLYVFVLFPAGRTGHHPQTGLGHYAPRPDLTTHWPSYKDKIFQRYGICRRQEHNEYIQIIKITSEAKKIRSGIKR